MARAEAALRVTLARSPRPDEVELIELTLPPGATLAEALGAAGWAAEPGGVGVWGRAQPLDHRLQDGDRVELTRGLRVDPKEARRLRYDSQRKLRRTRSR